MKRLLILCCMLLLCACGRPAVSESEVSSAPVLPPPGTSAPVVEPPADERVVHENETDYMSLVLPDDWAYEKTELCGLPTADDPEGRGYHETTIAFWPTADPDCTAKLTVRTAPMGICGTGVTFEKRTFALAGEGTVAYEDIEDNRWYMIFFETGKGCYDLEWSPTAVQRGTYEDTFWQIADTIELGK